MGPHYSDVRHRGFGQDGTGFCILLISRLRHKSESEDARKELCVPLWTCSYNFLFIPSMHCPARLSADCQKFNMGII